jgi:hypothetical protein
LTLVNQTNNLSIGFLTIHQDGNTFAGGYLVTNAWGRPLEFRTSSAVQPNRLQMILYGGTLQSYVCADLIGRALVEKAGSAVQLLVTDHDLVMDLRHRVSTPLLWLVSPADGNLSSELVLRPAQEGKSALACHPRYAEDAATIRPLLERVDLGFDLAEPFSRIREAMHEARKMNTGIVRAA